MPLALTSGYVTGCTGRVAGFRAGRYAPCAGFGHQLLTAAVAFTDDRAYRRAYLWTFEGLPADRHLYERHGFKLARSALGSQWGEPVREQLFVRGEA